MRGCIFLYTLIFILGSACQPSSNGNNVDLFNDISIELNSSEEVVEFTGVDTDAYFEILGDRPYQAPLYRKVESGEALLYIGIPVGTGTEEILGFREDAVIKSFDKWQYSYSQYEKGGVEIAECAVSRDGNAVLMVAEYPGREPFNSRFSADSLLSRLQLK